MQGAEVVVVVGAAVVVVVGAAVVVVVGAAVVVVVVVVTIGEVNLCRYLTRRRIFKRSDHPIQPKN